MRLRIRPLGNSLGVIVPRATLDEWTLGEGDYLELMGRCIRPPGRKVGTEDALDELKRALATAVVTRCPANLIRAHSLANLHRWKAIGSWVSAYDEWREILECGSDGELFAAMLGRDERANRLRQSPPYVGLLPRDEVKRINEDSPFDGEFGHDADRVDEGTATLPEGGKGRRALASRRRNQR